MTLYAVGDLQGCIDPLITLLDYVKFNPEKDHLWLTGDLINRGPDSIGSLEFVKNLGASATTVLGNHDLHVIALHELKQKSKDSDITSTLNHPNAPELLRWLRKQPILVRDKKRKLIMTHAGIPPVWGDRQARYLAKEVEKTLRSKKKRKAFLKAMYGNEPSTWTEDLEGHERTRFIVNAFTRMRFCSKKSKLDFKFKSSPQNAPPGMKPWYEWTAKRKHTLVFGHWASLMGHTSRKEIIGLDTGFVWGNHLTLMNLDSKTRYCCDTDHAVTEISELEFEGLSSAVYKSTNSKKITTP